MSKSLLKFTGWISCVYTFLFITSFYVHVNETNIISKKTQALLPKLSNKDKPSFHKVAEVQNMKRKTKPSFFEPATLFNSLFGKREFYHRTSRLIKNRIELVKGDLNNTIFENVHFEGINLSHSSMFNSNLKKANLENANFSYAKLAYADLRHANFHNANLRHSNLYKTNLHNTVLKGADLSDAVNVSCDQISSAIIDDNTRLPGHIINTATRSCSSNDNERRGLDLSNLYLENVRFDRENFSNANLSQANMKNSELYYTDFANANLEKAVFKGADLRTAKNITCEQLRSTIIDGKTQLPYYIYLPKSSSAFKCINLLKGKGVDLGNSNLSKINLYGYNANLRGANLSRANMKNSWLDYTDFANANLSSANLSQAYLRGANFRNANLSKTNLKGANLSNSIEFLGEWDRKIGPANLINANLSSANLSQAYLKGANFRNSNLSKTNLKGANLSKAMNISCEQIILAIIDKKTRLPDYIDMKKSSQATIKCKEIGKGQEQPESRITKR